MLAVHRVLAVFFQHHVDFLTSYQQNNDYDTFSAGLDSSWGYILNDTKVTAPLWLGEFGTCHTSFVNVNVSTRRRNGVDDR